MASDRNERTLRILDLAITTVLTVSIGLGGWTANQVVKLTSQVARLDERTVDTSDIAARLAAIEAKLELHHSQGTVP